jgi:hypothetical protein
MRVKCAGNSFVHERGSGKILLNLLERDAFAVIQVAPASPEDQIGDGPKNVMRQWIKILGTIFFAIFASWRLNNPLCKQSPVTTRNDRRTSQP